jgi:hypothetical protein
MNAIQKIFGKRQKVSIEVKDLKVSAGVGGTRKGKRGNPPFSRAQWGVSLQNTIYSRVQVIIGVQSLSRSAVSALNQLVVHVLYLCRPTKRSLLWLSAPSCYAI